MAEPMRVQRALARAGIASRRKAEELIVAGRVTVNGAVATVGQVVDPIGDKILVDGRRVGAPPKTVWMLLNKPTGVVTTRRDPGGRKTVFDLVQDQPGLTAAL
jgi:23S rRNA pseudouridine2605 synthase